MSGFGTAFLTFLHILSRSFRQVTDGCRRVVRTAATFLTKWLFQDIGRLKIGRLPDRERGRTPT